MKSTSLCTLTLGAFFGLLRPAFTYEVQTHAAITYNAYARSILSSEWAWRDLGIMQYLREPSTRHSPFGNTYYDVFGEQVATRNWYSWEFGSVPYIADSAQGVEDGFIPARDMVKVPGWLMIGAVREDDNPAEPNPKDDPYVPKGAFHREFNHFFDPAHNKRLSIAGLETYYARDSNGVDITYRAPDWAMGVDNGLMDSNHRNSDPMNHFTVFDAREAMFRALTLKRHMSDGTFADLAANESAGNRESMRKTYWATCFRAIGDVLHLNQDMAQPQHTRNEAHSGVGQTWPVGGDIAQSLFTGHASVYEKYLGARARATYPSPAQQREFFTMGGQKIEVPPIDFGAYPAPTFNRYSDYWSTGQYSAVSAGLGLADYSNRGFFTMANNLDGSAYDLPSRKSGDYRVEKTSVTYPGSLFFKREYLVGTVQDTLTGSADSIRMTTRGLFADVLSLRRGVSLYGYTLDAANYDEQASLLIPRSVAYSAGIINYFFRGKLEISPPDAGVYGLVDHSTFTSERTDVQGGFKGFDKIKLTLKNTTEDVLAPGASVARQSMSAGALLAVIKFHRNLCYDNSLNNWPISSGEARSCRSDVEETIVSDLAVDAGGSAVTAVPHVNENPDGVELTFKFAVGRQVPINAWDVTLQVVYRGKLGAEDDAVAVVTKDISEPMFTNYMNFTDYVLLDGNFYLPEQLAQDQFSQVSPSCRGGQSGNYSLNHACYDIDDYFAFTAGSSNVEIKIDSIPPRRLARMVMLGDFERPAEFGWQQGSVRCWVGVPNPFPTHPYQAQANLGGGFDYGIPSLARGVKGWYPQVCYSDIGAVQTPLEDVPWDQLPVLRSPDETSPLPLTVTNW